MIHTILLKTTLKRYKIVWFLGRKRVTQDLHNTSRTTEKQETLSNPVLFSMLESVCGQLFLKPGLN